jgi:flagellar biosynthesis protein
MAKPANDAQKSAVALAYSQTDAAPRVVAKGRGLVAEQIIARAREHGVYVHESPELVSLLLQVDLDQRIPPQLYIAVAELLAWIYRLESGQPVAASPFLTPLPGVARQVGAQLRWAIAAFVRTTAASDLPNVPDQFRLPAFRPEFALNSIRRRPQEQQCKNEKNHNPDRSGPAPTAIRA